MLLYFFIGALFMLCAQPILSSLTELICAVFETLQTKLSKIVAKDTLDIKKMAVEAANLAEDEEETPRVIGFVAPDFEEEYDDEEGEDEDE